MLILRQKIRLGALTEIPARIKACAAMEAAFGDPAAKSFFPNSLGRNKHEDWLST